MMYEDFSTEILEVVCEAFNDDKDLLSRILISMYGETTNDNMKSQIVDIVSDMGYCLECGSKMQYYEWSEQTSQGAEPCCILDCPCCGDTKNIEGVIKK